MKRLAAILAVLLLACAAGAQMLPGSSAAFAAFASKLSVAGALVYFDFNDGTGRDLSPYARDLVNVGSVTYGEGYGGGGLAPFFGAAGKRLTNGFSASAIRCIEFNFNLTNALTATMRDAYPIVMGFNGENVSMIAFGPATTLVLSEFLTVTDQNSGNARTCAVAGYNGNPTSIATGWHHLRIAKRSSSDSLYAVWLDGVELVLNPNNVTNLSASFLCVGEYPGAANPAGGYIDNLLISEKALNEQ